MKKSQRRTPKQVAMKSHNAPNKPKPNDEKIVTEPAIRVMMMPRDTNAQGTIFGGVILSYLDQAGAIEARKHGQAHVVTVAMDHIEFKQPVFVGDVLSFRTSTLQLGRSSVRIQVQVEAERFEPPCERVPVTTAEVVYVAIDEFRRPVPFPK